MTQSTEQSTESRTQAGWTEITDVDGADRAAGRADRAGPRQGPPRADRPRRRLAGLLAVLRASRPPRPTATATPRRRATPPAQLVHVIDERTIAHRRASRQPARRRLPQRPAEPARRAALPDPRPRRHPADQRPRPAGLRRAVLRRDGRQGPPAGAGPGGRDRRGLPPLRQGVPALHAVGPGDLGPRGPGAAPRRARPASSSARRARWTSSTSTTARRTPRSSTAARWPDGGRMGLGAPTVGLDKSDGVYGNP